MSDDKEKKREKRERRGYFYDACGGAFDYYEDHAKSTYRFTNGKKNGNKFSFKVYESGWRGGSRAQIRTHQTKNAAKVAGKAAGVLGGIVSLENLCDAYEEDKKEERRTGEVCCDNFAKCLYEEGFGMAGSYAGTAIGSLAGPIGAAVGSVVGGIAGGFLGDMAFESDKKHMERIRRRK